MEVNLSEFVTLVGLAVASAVGIYRAAIEIVREKALKVYTILASTAVALLAVYADRISVS